MKFSGSFQNVAVTARVFRLKAEVTHAAWGHAAYTISIVGRVTDPAHSLKCPKFWVIPHDLSLKAFSLQSIYLISYTLP